MVEVELLALRIGEAEPYGPLAHVYADSSAGIAAALEVAVADIKPEPTSPLAALQVSCCKSRLVLFLFGVLPILILVLTRLGRPCSS